jgi:tetratricopeptide (TPR) repeat protein
MSDLLSLFSEGKYAQFLTIFAAGAVEESRELSTCKGIAQMRTGDVKNARSTFKQLLESNPDDTEVKIYMAAVGNSLIHKALDEGNGCLQSNDFAAAIAAYGQVSLDEYTGLNSDLVYQLLNNRAVCLLNSGRPEEALAVFESSTMASCMSDEAGSDNIKKRRIDVYFNTAIVLKTLGRFQDALDAFEKVLTEDTAHVTAACGKSEVLNHLGRHDEALETAMVRVEAMRSAGDNISSSGAGLLVAMGFALMKLLRYEEAMGHLQEALTACGAEGDSPVKTEAHRLRGLCRSMQANALLSSGDNAGAVVVFDEVIAETPAGQVPLSVIFNRSLAHMQLGSAAASAEPSVALQHLDEAISGYDQVVQHDSNHFQGKVGLGQALLLKADCGAGRKQDQFALVSSLMR